MTEEKNHIARLVNVTKRYEGPHGGTLALKDVSIDAGQGEMILILGPSGSGKTTLLTILAGLQSATYGEVYLFGKQTKEYNQKELQALRASRLGFIFQTFYLLDSLTVLQNVMMVKKFSGAGKAESRKASINYLERFGVGELADKYPARISQGEKQRAAIARALVTGAELIIADEPTGSLASQQGIEIIEFLKNITRDEKRCVILTSHDPRIVSYADRIYYLSDGILEDYQ